MLAGAVGAVRHRRARCQGGNCALNCRKARVGTTQAFGETDGFHQGDDSDDRSRQQE